MSHPDEGVLQELLDGELAPADAAAVRAHLAGCVPCAVILRDLAAVQAESDAIVARLPLDPPLVKPGTRARARRSRNLRTLGLAASLMLVAGTSWVLLRTSRQTFAARDEAPAGLALPMPSEERQEVPATTPDIPPPAAEPGAAAAAPPAPKLRADANGDQAAKAKQAPREADASATQPLAKDLQSQAKSRPEQEAANAVTEKKEADQVPVGGNRPADAPVPASLAAGAARASGSLTTVTEAEAGLGTRLRSISGLTPFSVELLPLGADSVPAVRQRYLVNGVTVVLVQRGSPAPDTRALAATAGKPLAASRVDRTSKARAPESAMDSLGRMREDRGCEYAGDCGSGTKTAIRTWEAGGSFFELRGPLPADSMDALVKRVK